MNGDAPGFDIRIRRVSGGLPLDEGIVRQVFESASTEEIENLEARILRNDNESARMLFGVLGVSCVFLVLTITSALPALREDMTRSFAQASGWKPDADSLMAGLWTFFGVGASLFGKSVYKTMFTERNRIVRDVRVLAVRDEEILESALS